MTQPRHAPRLPAPPGKASDPDPSTLPLYQGIAIGDVLLVRTRADEDQALRSLMASDAIGFDTESKPTFAKGEVSNGPHLVQLATDRQVFLFQIGSAPTPTALKTVLESPGVLKAGFGLRDDLRRLQSKLGIHADGVIDLGVALRRDKRGDVGAKTAVARFFGQRLQKSKKISTTNWANPRLTEAQMLYAANDAHVALRVYRAWRMAEGDAPTAALRAVAAPGTRPSWPQRLARFWSRLRPKRPPGRDRGA
jgi:RNA polymerase sigma factor for flagellar operon FliA